MPRALPSPEKIIQELQRKLESYEMNMPLTRDGILVLKPGSDAEYELLPFFNLTKAMLWKINQQLPYSYKDTQGRTDDFAIKIRSIQDHGTGTVRQEAGLALADRRVYARYGIDPITSMPFRTNQETRESYSRWRRV